MRVFLLLVGIRVGLVDIADDVSFLHLGERTEVALAEFGDDLGLFATREHELLLDDHEDEARLVREAVVHEFELRDEVLLAAVIVVEADVVKVADNVFGSGVLFDLAGRVEADHVARVDLARDLEDLFEAVLLDRLLPGRRERDDKVHSRVGVVLFVVLQRRQMHQ